MEKRNYPYTHSTYAVTGQNETMLLCQQIRICVHKIPSMEDSI